MTVLYEQLIYYFMLSIGMELEYFLLFLLKINITSTWLDFKFEFSMCSIH